jgi:hypothetical protein
MKVAKLPLFSLAVGLAVTPFLLPRRFRVAQRVVIRGRPSEIFPYLDSLKNWPLWTPWNRQRPLDFHYEGPDAGVGAAQYWTGKCTAGSVRILQSHADERVTFKVAMRGDPRDFEGVLSLEPLGDSTRVVWYCRWERNASPYLRYLDLFIKWRMNHDFLDGLENLKELVEETGHSA